MAVERDRLESDIPVGPDAPAGNLSAFGQLVRETLLHYPNAPVPRIAVRTYQGSSTGGDRRTRVHYMFRVAWTAAHPVDIHVRLRHTVESDLDGLKGARLGAMNAHDCIVQALVNEAPPAVEFDPHGDRDVARFMLGKALPPTLVRAVE